MFCWPSRRNNSTKNRKKSKSSTDFSTGDDDDPVSGKLGLGSGGILVKPYKPLKKGKNKYSASSGGATFKCDLSEALLSPSDECLLSSRSASCNSSFRDLHSYHHRTNKHFVSSSQHLPSSNNNFPGTDRVGKEADSVSVNNNDNNNRSAEVLIFYSNNSLSTRNSLADFMENEEFNYKSLWGKDISEWDSRESKYSTLERDDCQANYYVKTGTNAKNGDKKTDNNGVIIATKSILRSIVSDDPKSERLASASSSPSLTISVTECNNRSNHQNKSFTTTTSTNFVEDDDDEPLPSPPPTPPEAKRALSKKSSLENCSFFKYPTSELESAGKPQESLPFRIHSSTSTSSLSSSCILTPEIIEKPLSSPTTIHQTLIDGKTGVSDCETQTLPFWQLEFPGILHCSSCSHSSEDSGIIVNNPGTLLEDSTTQSTVSSSGVADTPTPSSSILCASRGHESPGGDSSSSGISSSDDNLESLHADEEIMLKSLKNSFLHQAIPFQLCSFGSVCGSNNGRHAGSRCTCCKDKSALQIQSSGGDSVITSIANNNSSVHSIINNEFANSVAVVTNSNLIEKQKEQEQNYKNKQQLIQRKEKCELPFQETISSSSVTNHQDRNRLGPVGKNYGSGGLDANANESAGSDVHNRSHEQSNGDIGKSLGTAEPHIDSVATRKSGNNRVSSTNQLNIQNSLLIQENSSLKEEVSRLSSVVSDLQLQITKLASSKEETQKALEEQVTRADLSCKVLGIVAQQVDEERSRLSDGLLKEKVQSKNWKLQLDEKLAELKKLNEEYDQERELHQEELRTLSSNHEIEVDVTVRNCENKLEQMQKRHDGTLAELKRSHTDELERLQEAQRNELEQTISKHRELLDQHRNQSPHDILHKEVESLQVVLDMRNEEIRVLRKDLMDYKNTLNDLQMAREHGKSLSAKIEDLEAQLEKARSDKRSLQERYQALEAHLQQLESENNRLARVNDELNWKMKSYNLVEN